MRKVVSSINLHASLNPTTPSTPRHGAPYIPRCYRPVSDMASPAQVKSCWLGCTNCLAGITQCQASVHFACPSVYLSYINLPPSPSSPLLSPSLCVSMAFSLSSLLHYSSFPCRSTSRSYLATSSSSILCSFLRRYLLHCSVYFLSQTTLCRCLLPSALVASMALKDSFEPMPPYFVGKDWDSTTTNVDLRVF